MNKIALIFFLCLANFAFSQSSIEEKEVEASVEKLKTAMIDGSKQALENIVLDELSYGHSSGAVENKTEFVEKIVSGKSDFVTITLTNQTIKVAENCAIVRHTLAATTNNDGKPGEVNLNIMLIWQKKNGQWKLLARQAVKVPQ